MARVHRLMPGQTFAGDYVVERLLGQGTMGAVYLARQTSSGLPRALKLMNAELTADPKASGLFTQEAQIGARIASPHIVEVVAAGVDEATKMPWLAMELVVGVDLATYLDQAPPPSPAAIQRILEQLFGAIGAAHAASVVHRDLKPENIMVSTGEGESGDRREGEIAIKVLDFGVAKVITGVTLVGTGSGLGTPVWAAPEQSGTKKPVRPPADVWALGLITFRALTGTVYWRSVANERSSALDVAKEILRAPIEPATARAAELGRPGLLPAGFDAWFARCVVRDPDARFPNATAAWAALAPMLDARGRRSGAIPIAAILALAALVVALIALALTRR